MSVITPTLDEYRTQLKADIVAAWTGGNAPKDIFEEDPRSEEGDSDLPYVVYEIQDVEEGPEVEGGGGVVVGQRIVCEIRAVFAMPTSGSIMDFKADRMDELTQKLMPSGGHYGTHGFLPFVTKRRFNEGDNLQRDRIEFSLTHSVGYATDYH